MSLNQHSLNIGEHIHGTWPDENDVTGKETGQGKKESKQTESVVKVLKVKAV